MATETENAPAAVRRFGPWGCEVRAFLELFALAGIAFVQPTLDLLGKNSGLFVIWRTDEPRYFALIALLLFVPPVVGWLLEVAVGLIAPRAREWAHIALVGILAAIIGAEIVKKVTELGPVPIVVLGIAAGIGGALLIRRFEIAREWLRFLAIAPVIFAVLFVVSSPARPSVLFGTPKAAEISVREPNRVVMIVLDEFPLSSLMNGRGEVDAELYPNIAALAQGSTWYRNDTTVAPITDLAVPAILTGRWPEDGRAVPAAARYPENLFTLLGGEYDLNVHEIITTMCPKSLCPNVAPPTAGRTGFRAMAKETFDLWKDFAQPERTEALSLGALNAFSEKAMREGNRFVRSLRPSDGPQLDFLHVALPHFPWYYLATGQTYIAARSHQFGFDGEKWISEWDALSSHQRHLLQVQATDSLIGSVVSRLKEIGEYDSTLFVVTADHGASFTNTEPFRAVSAKNYPDILWTPLFIKAPNQAQGAVDDRCARSIDIVPTILDHLGARAPWKLDGRSLVGPAHQCEQRRVFDWSANTVEPEDGSSFVSLDSQRGFARVRSAQAAPPGDPALRLYGVGAYRSLIGKDAEPLFERGESPIHATIDSAARYDTIDPAAPVAWWPLISGTVATRRAGMPLAIIINGRIGGFSETNAEVDADNREYSTMVPTSLFNLKGNDVQIARILGTPENPRLQRLPLDH